MLPSLIKRIIAYSTVRTTQSNTDMTTIARYVVIIAKLAGNKAVDAAMIPNIPIKKRP